MACEVSCLHCATPVESSIGFYLWLVKETNSYCLRYFLGIPECFEISRKIVWAESLSARCLANFLMSESILIPDTIAAQSKTGNINLMVCNSLYAHFVMAVPWTSLDSTPGQRVFRRPLGVTEIPYYWDGVFNSTGDTVMHVHLRTTQKNDQDIYSQSNVMRSWASVKRRFPLIAAEIEEHDSRLHFVIREEAVTNLRPNDVTFMEVDSFHRVECFIDEIMDGHRPLSSRLLSRAYILRRTDKSDQFHALIVIAHIVTDASSTSTVLRTFFDTLSSRIEPPCIPLGERVHMFQPLENRLCYGNLPLVKRRWRRALGYALYTVWISKFKGGHTLPGAIKKSTRYTPAISRSYTSTFSRQISSNILSNCHRHHVTLNTAFYVLSQVAMTRILCRRYLRGQIPEEEWEYRKRQPSILFGAMNLRPYQDKDWFETGGSGDVGFNVSFFQYTLPFMPLGEMSRGDVSKLELVDGAPDFSVLMSFDRFLLRCANIKAQAQKMFKHPRFVDICTAGHDRIASTREVALNWLKMGDAVFSDTDSHPNLPVQSMNPIITQKGSSLGNMDDKIPPDYPLHPEHHLSPLCSTPHPHRAGYPTWYPPAAALEDAKTPRLHIEHWRTHFHARPAHLHLAATSTHDQLQYFMFYDQRVFSEEIIKEWVHELKDATLWYLGRSHVDESLVRSKL